MKRVAVITASILFAFVATASIQAQVPVKEGTPGLLARAKVRSDSAERIALRQVPGGKVVKAEIEMEDNTLVYAFNLAVEGKSGVEEVLVDANTGTVVKTEHEDESATGEQGIKEEDPGLLRQATVSPDSARAIALRRIAGGRIVGAEIEREGGKLVYSFDLKVENKDGVEEVLVDAKTGAVVSVEHEND